MIKATQGGSFCFSRQLVSPSLREARAGTQRGAWRQTFEELCSLACLVSLLSHAPHDCYPGVAPLTMGWTLPHQSVIKKMHYRLIPTTNSFRGIFSVETPSFPITLIYVKLTMN